VSIAWVFWPRKRARTVSGAAMAGASSWRCAAVAASTAARRAVSRICSAARSAPVLGWPDVCGPARHERRARRRPDRTSPPRCEPVVSGGPVRHQLSCVGQVPGQAGAVVAGALHRPRAQPGARMDRQRSTEATTLSEEAGSRRSAQRSGAICLHASGRRFDPCRAHLAEARPVQTLVGVCVGQLRYRDRHRSEEPGADCRSTQKSRPE
jgi:hypothetical protein